MFGQNNAIILFFFTKLGKEEKNIKTHFGMTKSNLPQHAVML